jgi:hypothetical protein
MKTCDQLQTVAVTYQEICQGEMPWIALGYEFAEERALCLKYSV